MFDEAAEIRNRPLVKIVYNARHRGFGLSDEAWELFKARGGKVERHWELDRADPILVAVVEELGKRANGPYAELCIAKVPKGTKYRIAEYDGAESVMEFDDYDWKVA